MLDLTQELMTPDEAAGWFRRSPSWLRHQPDLVRVGGPAGQPLYHVQVCRAYVLGRICGLTGDCLRRVQIKALAAACGIPLDTLSGDEVRPAITLTLPPDAVLLPPEHAPLPPKAASRSAQAAVPRTADSASFSSIAPS